MAGGTAHRRRVDEPVAAVTAEEQAAAQAHIEEHLLSIFGDTVDDAGTEEARNEANEAEAVRLQTFTADDAEAEQAREFFGSEAFDI